jgi:tetratricopeptide (TPR) repeat protein
MSLGAAAQDASEAQSSFEEGRYDDALRLINERRQGGGAGPEDTYLAAQALVRLERRDDARNELGSLDQFGQPWSDVGQSARALLDGNLGLAGEAAGRAVVASPDQFVAQYQLGQALMEAQNWPLAAAAFERASELRPTFAYAHYYAGLASSRIQRIDRTALHFEYFLKLAPMAPERLAVESIMRTLRGR